MISRGVFVLSLLLAVMLATAATWFCCSAAAARAMRYEFQEGFAPRLSGGTKAMWCFDRTTGDAWVTMWEDNAVFKAGFWYRIKSHNEADQMLDEAKAEESRKQSGTPTEPEAPPDKYLLEPPLPK